MVIKLKKGGDIHIKEKNKGKFTSYCGGNVTSACIAKAKASGNPRIKDVIVLKNGGQIRKMQTAAGGPLNLSPEDIKKGANLIGEYFLKGLGAFGKIATAPFRSQGPTSATIYKSKELLAKERTIENKSEELLGKAMTWVSPLNYGAALATGNGFNARKGEEEVASWSPAWQALGRAAELYVGPKAVKGVKAAPKVVVNTAAKVGSKTAKKAVIARELRKNTKNTKLDTPNRYVTRSYSFNDDGNISSVGYQLIDPITGKPLGNAVFSSPYPGAQGRIVGWIESQNKAHGVSEDLYNIGVLDAKLAGLPGLESGWDLMEPLKTLNVTKKFPHKVIGESEGHPVRLLTGTTNKQQPTSINLSNHYIYLNNIRYNLNTGNFEEVTPVIDENKLSLKFFERKPSKNNIVGTSLDYSMKDSKGMDFIKQFFALLKINGKEYTLEGLKDAKNVQQGLPEYIQSYLNLNTVERAVRAMRKNGYSEREILLYVDKVNEEMNKVKVGMYSDLEYNAAGALDFGGFYNSDTNFISINKDALLTPNYIMKHEGRHLIDYKTSMTDDVINILEKAYDKDFLEIPKHEDAGNLKDYLHMDRERVTTNRDAREVLLSNLEKHPGEFLNLTKFAQTSSGKYKDMVDFLNELILYADPEDIINAIENSNGYGKRYINYLKKNNKLTSTKIEQLRLAMIHVPSYLLPIAGGYTLYNLFNQPKQQLQYLKQGGKMNILEFLKNGSGIHIKEKNKGKFTSYCGGKVTDECILKGKNSSNPATRKRATFAANVRKWKHLLGGRLYNAGSLPEIIVNGYAPMRLTTYYPFVSKYPYTGHSKLDIPIDRKTWVDYTGEEPSSDRIAPYVTIDKLSWAKDYNLVTNNCADATLKYLNKAFGTSESPVLFTTPGDVRDYAINKLHGKVIKNNNGSDTVLIPRNKNNALKLSTTALNMFDGDINGTAGVSYKAMFKRQKGGKLCLVPRRK